jgi:putative transposase
MPRIARIIAPGIPHHVTQRGNRRMQTFFCDDDYQAYIDLMAEWCDKCHVEIWAYCLMPNHTHMVALPETEDGLRRAIGEAHRLFTRRINFREEWRGHLWQGRFASFPMDERHLFTVARYVEMNPVRAKLVTDPVNWRWSSAAAHVSGKDDQLVKVAPLLNIIENWNDFLLNSCTSKDLENIRRQERSGRPFGKDSFIEDLEKNLNRKLMPQKRGPKPKRPA